MTNHRDAITGKFVTAEHVELNPNTTVSESPCAECERLRGVNHAQGVALDGYREEVERLRAAEPIVRTVGDLTARHVGKRVRGRTWEGELLLLQASAACVDIVLEGKPYPYQLCLTLDTPCEVLS